MKLIEQSKLYFREGNSDKVYEVDLCKLSENEYLVNFRYGRRGSTLKEGTKTPAAVSLEKAKAIFSKLDSEKRSKGYLPDTQTYIELPVLDKVEADPLKKTILQRLQDALDGKNSFKTEWKTSRVIWKAGTLQMKDAVPYIIRLAAKGDEMQTYSSLWALARIKAREAEPLLQSYAFWQKQKPYIRHIACEGLLSILEGKELSEFARKLVEKLPDDIQEDIETGNYDNFASDLAEDTEQGSVDYFTNLYLLTKVRPDLLPHLNRVLAACKLRPPYFIHIRAIYKLAQVRKDYATLSVLTYRFEKESPMFNRQIGYGSDYRQYISECDKSVYVGAELRKSDSKIAFSQFTKNYFQKNSVEYIKKTGANSDAKEYLKLAVSTLLRYSETDYKPQGETLYSDYGQYDYNKKIYYFFFTNRPECYDSYLLSTILFGNDKDRILQRNLTYVYGKRTVWSQHYYYNASKVKPLSDSETTGNNNTNKTQSSEKQDSSVFGFIKSIFGGKKENPINDEKTEVSAPQAEKEIHAESKRAELYPEHWDSMPEAYVQLLMQAKMNIIHKFAYDNLNVHADLNQIIRRFDADALLMLLDNDFKIPNKFGSEVFEKRKDEFVGVPSFIGKVLNSNSANARALARTIVDADKEFYTNDLDFMVSLVFNIRKINNSWINELLQGIKFEEDRQQAMLGKAVSELLLLDNTQENNDLAKAAINRISIISGNQFHKVSWDVIEHLIVSPLLSNIWLAGNILIRKSEKVNPEEIPISLVTLFLNNEIPEVRKNGIQLLNNYPDNFLINNFNFILNLVDNSFHDVLVEITACIQKLLSTSSTLGNKTAQHFVYALIRKEKFEGAHEIIGSFLKTELKTYWNTGLNAKDITKLIHSQYRQSQLTGFDILRAYDKQDGLTLGQIISFGSHEILAIRQWCWTYFKENVSRIRYEKEKAFNLLDSKWDDTREYAFHFFRTEFSESDWDSDTLISITDSVRSDVEAFGKELITKFFKPENGMEYLTKLSEHPGVNIQAFVANYLSLYAAGKKEVIRDLEFYFRSVLTRVNKARTAKNRIFAFLHEEALKDADIAAIIVPVLDDVSAQSTIQDKAACIRILTEIKTLYPHLDMHLIIK